MKRKLLVVNQYYAPDLASTGQYAAGICSGLASDAFEVTVVAAKPCYTDDAPDAPDREVRDGVEVHRISLAGIRGRESHVSRFSGYAVFMAAAWRKARSIAASWSPDVVMTFHNPPLAGLIGAHLSRKLDVPFVYSPYDILPDVVMKAGWPLPDVAFRAWDRLNSVTYRRADRVVVLSEGMRDLLIRDKGVEAEKIEVVRLWGRPEIDGDRPSADVRDEVGVDRDALLLLYAGNMGYLHRIDAILEAARRVEDQPVEFVFVGGGPRKADVRREMDENGSLDNVTVLPYQSEETFCSLVAAADAAFVTLEDGMGHLAFPSRTLSFLSAGTPIIAITSDRAPFGEWVTTSGTGWQVSDGEQLAEHVRELVEDGDGLSARSGQARRTYREEFGRSETVAAYQEILSGAMESTAA